jgi:ubiquinone/menaquinone biosynthesis C-methylase UbiE
VGFYAKHILPHVIDVAMKNPSATRLRAEWIPNATGDVLEIGIGSGLNLPFYTDRVRRVYGLDPSLELQQMALRRVADLPFRVEFIPQPAESPIPLRTGSIDTAVLTWTLCSVREPLLVLSEIGRVMNPDGRLIFIEHGSAPDVRVRSWQDRLTPWWKRFTGGCHLNRNVRTIIDRSGYEVLRFDSGYLPGPRPMTFTYRGVARHR